MPRVRTIQRQEAARASHREMLRLASRGWIGWFCKMELQATRIPQGSALGNVMSAADYPQDYQRTPGFRPGRPLAGGLATLHHIGEPRFPAERRGPAHRLSQSIRRRHDAGGDQDRKRVMTTQ